MDKTIHFVGNAHLDPVWLWRWQEGCNEVLQTFRSALDRMREYPDFIFTCSSAAYYKWAKELEPEMFEEIKMRIAQGRWVIVGGWWVQPDCNSPSGESFARQALYSQRFYYENFGKICSTGYNVDSFGHNGNMPQLLKNGGMNAYVMMRPGKHENSEIPEWYMIWEGVDGTRIPTVHLPDSYGTHNIEKIESELCKVEKYFEDGGKEVMLFYGIGNHGGGPSRRDIEYLLEEMKTHENYVFSSPDKFFKESDKSDLPLWRGDLQHHASGCYAVTSSIKALNRKAENALCAAEIWDAAANALYGAPASTNKLGEAWEKLLFNQFHDILCGCSIREAYEDAAHSSGAAIDTAENIRNNALIRISRKINTWIDGVSEPAGREVRHYTDNGFPRPVVIFNPAPFDIDIPVRGFNRCKEVTDAEGNIVNSQTVWASKRNCGDTWDTMFRAKVPAMGYSLYWFVPGEREDKTESALKVDRENLIITNSVLTVKFSKQDGTICSLIKDGKETVKERAALPVVIDDSDSDTWAHMVFRFNKKMGEMKLKTYEWIECGSLLATLRMIYTYGESELWQEFTLSEDSPAVYVKCKVFWREPTSLLKIAFNVPGQNHISTSEIPYGYIKRPANGEEEPMQSWTDLTGETSDGEKTGISIINDSKYSYDSTDGTLNLTALRNCVYADHYWKDRTNPHQNYTDEGLQFFEYAVYPHSGEADTETLTKLGLLFNRRPFTVLESYHRGEAPSQMSFIKTDKENVLITALKKSENGDGATVIRLLETSGKDAEVTVTSEALNLNHTLKIDKNKIVTLYVKDGIASETDFLEGLNPTV